MTQKKKEKLVKSFLQAITHGFIVNEHILQQVQNKEIIMFLYDRFFWHYSVDKIRYRESRDYLI